MRSPEDWAAVLLMVARLDRIDATFVGWSDRMDARLVLIREDPTIYLMACRQRDQRDHP